MTRLCPKRPIAVAALCAALAACGTAPVDLPPPPGSEPAPPVEAPPPGPSSTAESPPPGEIAAVVPRLPDRPWLAAEGPIFDWRAEGVIGSADRASPPPGAAPAATPTVSSGEAAAEPPPGAAAAGAEPPPAATEPLVPPVAAGADLPWYQAPGPIFDWRSERSTAPTPVEPAAPLAPWQQRERRIRQLPGWRLSGRVAIAAPDESWSAVVRWEQAGDAFHVRLSNPLGQGLADLRGVPGEVLLTTAEGAIYRAPDADTLLRDVAGLRLPVAGLRYWVLAVTDPALAAADVTVDADSLPEALQQGGWRVEYDRYREAGTMKLPDRLSFEGDDLRGRLIITEWQVDGT